LALIDQRSFDAVCFIPASPGIFLWTGVVAHDPQQLGVGWTALGECIAWMNSDVQQIPVFYAGGWVGKGLFWDRPDDMVVLGFSHASWSPSVPTDQGWESIVQLGYQVAFGDNVTLQPNLQWVFNPSGTGSVPDALVLGMQMSFLF
jgi:carbohydrate-selective porin OprB